MSGRRRSLGPALAELPAQVARQHRAMGTPRSATSGSVIVGIRAAPDQPRRARNVGIALRSLNRQTLERSRYRVIVVEQAEAPHCRQALEPLVDEYLFVYNPGPYNRGWAFNVGANLAGWSGALCLFDSDLVVPRDFLAGCFDRSADGALWAGGARALKPHSTIEYLDEASSDALAAAVNSDDYDLARFRGTPWKAVGGCICVDGALYRQMGGHDERFRGWGKEDKEFWARLTRLAAVSTVEKRLVHLHHEPVRYDDAAKQNRRLYAMKQAGEDGWPDGPVGDPLRYAGEQRPPLVPLPKTTVNS